MSLASCSPTVDTGPTPSEPQPLEGDINLAGDRGVTHASTDHILDSFRYLSSTGDLDGDGCDDLVLSGGSAYSDDHGYASSATILYGEAAPLRERPWGHASTKIFGGATSTRAVGVGDLDGDGFPELAVQTEAEGLRVFRGGVRRTELDLDDADLIVDADQRELLLPASGRGGDVTGDGLADLVVGRYDDERSAYSPTVYIIPGAPGIFANSPLRYDEGATTTVTMAGGHVTPALVEDVDGDGSAEFVLAYRTDYGSPIDLAILRGGPSLAGEVELSTAAAELQQLGAGLHASSLQRSNSGATTLLISDAAHLEWGSLDEQPSELQLTPGTAMGAGDLDGDGFADILVDQVDTAVLFYGGPEQPEGPMSAAATIHIPSQGLEIHRTTPIGDFNCDGFDDVAFARSGHHFGAGDLDVYILYGAPR